VTPWKRWKPDPNTVGLDQGNMLAQMAGKFGGNARGGSAGSSRFLPRNTEGERRRF
jgi:hypothetical protein